MASTASAAAAARNRPRIAGRPPAAVGALDDRVDKRAQRDDHQHLGDRVLAARCGGTRLRYERGGQRDGGKPDRDVDPENAPPAHRGRQDPAEGRPAAMPTPNMPTQTLIARVRATPLVKTPEMIDTATGLSIEPPAACSTRNAISQPRLGATEHSADPAVNTASPTGKPFCARTGRPWHPRRSAGWPASSCNRQRSTANPTPRSGTPGRSSAARCSRSCHQARS